MKRLCRRQTNGDMLSFCPMNSFNRRFTSSFALCTLLISATPAARADDGNQVQVINHGVAAFEKRFQMIEHAQHSIDVEYFIYNTDEAGRLFTQALIQKKLESPGVRIRILVDASPTVLQLKGNFVSEMAEHGLEVKYYNNISLLQFSKAQFRDHRKIVMIDGQEAITGSRNIADEYFDMSKTFNFRDRDIWMQGPVVQDIQASFDAYWTNQRTTPGETLTSMDQSKQVKLQKAAKTFVQETKYDRSLRVAIHNVGSAILAEPDSMGSCNSLTYVGDTAGYQSPETRRVLPALFRRMNKIPNGGTLTIESPYFIVRDAEAKKEMARLKKKDIQAVLLTNSLASTDAYYVAANFYPNASFYQSLSNSKMYIFEGNTPVSTPFLRYKDSGAALTEKATWGIHSKTFVFSDESFAIGTFNVDPRSANLNSEMLMFCEGSQSLAKFVLKDIEKRITQSDLLGKDGKLPDGHSIFDHVGLGKRLKFKAAMLPSEWFSYLL